MDETPILKKLQNVGKKVKYQKVGQKSPKNMKKIIVKNIIVNIVTILHVKNAIMPNI